MERTHQVRVFSHQTVLVFGSLATYVLEELQVLWCTVSALKKALGCRPSQRPVALARALACEGSEHRECVGREEE